MSRKFKVGFWIVVAGQLALLLTVIGIKEQTYRSGTTVVLQAAPVDPRSLLQGDYVNLNYEIALLPQYLSDLPSGSAVFVSLVEKGDVWEGISYDTGKPSGKEVFIKGFVGRPGMLEFGIGTYFVPEGTGLLIERAQDLKVRVAISSGGAALIKEVLVDGQPFEPRAPDIREPRRPPQEPPVPEKPQRVP
ncbi:MAG: GDYXXLXY domain-containing protein [Dehalococcoidia bacterium]|jgi:uncharacterized membrane-anchored protein|nr:GDYXXLXY domain-containing protein [Dehalococcoidia bacterium]